MMSLHRFWLITVLIWILQWLCLLTVYSDWLQGWGCGAQQENAKLKVQLTTVSRPVVTKEKTWIM